MAKFHKLRGTDSYMFFCPGCKNAHRVPVAGPKAWEWNGDIDKPTIYPSYRVVDVEFGCHLYIKNGMVEYLADCHHTFAGQTVPLPEFEV